jgi:hypothetical protein
LIPQKEKRQVKRRILKKEEEEEKEEVGRIAKNARTMGRAFFFRKN